MIIKEIFSKFKDNSRTNCTFLEFSCDGCLRLLAKLTAEVSRLHNQTKRFDECNQKIKDLEESTDEKN